MGSDDDGWPSESSPLQLRSQLAERSMGASPVPGHGTRAGGTGGRGIPPRGNLRAQVLRQLGALNETQLETLIFEMNLPAAYLPGREQPHQLRCIEVLRMVQGWDPEFAEVLVRVERIQGGSLLTSREAKLGRAVLRGGAASSGLPSEPPVGSFGRRGWGNHGTCGSSSAGHHWPEEDEE